jgi:hypothetical protein
MSCCCFVTISTAEVGVIERFGKFTRYVLYMCVCVCVVAATVAAFVQCMNDRISTLDECDTNEWVLASVDSQQEDLTLGYFRTTTTHSFYLFLLSASCSRVSV